MSKGVRGRRDNAHREAIKAFEFAEASYEHTEEHVADQTIAGLFELWTYLDFSSCLRAHVRAKGPETTEKWLKALCGVTSPMRVPIEQYGMVIAGLVADMTQRPFKEEIAPCLTASKKSSAGSRKRAN